MPLKRTTHWATRELAQFLSANAKAAFAWGTMDCCLFPASGIQAMTGVDIAADFRGKYHDEASAIALVKSVCNGSTVADAAAFCAAKAGLVEWAKPLLAQRGDLVVVDNSGPTNASGFGVQIAGLVHANGRQAVTMGPKGLVVLPITKVLRAWKV